MKKWFIPLVVLFALVFLLASCTPAAAPSSVPPSSSQPAATTSAPASSAAPSSSAPASTPAQVIKLSFTCQGPPTGWIEAHTINPWIEQVKQATNGRLVFEPYYSNSLAPANATWDSMMSGVVDAGFVSFHLWPGLTTLTGVISLPFLKYKNSEQQSSIAWKLYEQFPEIQNEYKANKLLALVTSSPFFFLTNKKQIKNKDDFKGLKIRSTAGEAIWTLVQNAGATPVAMPTADIYSNLEKGVIDGAQCNWDFFQTYRLYEVGQYYFYGPFNASVVGVAMSHSAWNKLPKDVQDQLWTVCGLKGSAWWGKTNYDESEGPARQKAKMPQRK
jgi:TRAP-type C4-dicarboxylate transport system substrate-binding protein